jgi:hypothetical protein
MVKVPLRGARNLAEGAELEKKNPGGRRKGQVGKFQVPREGE